MNSIVFDLAVFLLGFVLGVVSCYSSVKRELLLWKRRSQTFESLYRQFAATIRISEAKVNSSNN